ncbi:MAG: Ku protein [Acidimicrobiales bacterium]
MARPIWTGFISFGLVSIPVGLFSAVEEKSVRFHQLEQGTSDRIRYKKVNERTGKEVANENIVKGYEVAPDRYVVLSSEELEGAGPSASRSVEIEDFVDQAEIDPVFYDRTYYLAPKDEAAARPYGLLLEAMRSAGKVGVATFVMRGKEHLAAIRAGSDGSVLVLETMFFADEVRDPRRAIGSPAEAEAPKERELSAAVSLIESMRSDFTPERYQDRYRRDLMALIEAKHSGEEVLVGSRPEPDSNVVDLMEALSRSVERIRGERDGHGARPAAMAAGSRVISTASTASTTSTTAGTEPEQARAGSSRPRASATSRRAGSSGRGKKQTSSEQLSMLSKEELYELAQSLEVPGRSRMNRGELELAVSRAKAPLPDAEPREGSARETGAKRGQRRAS